MSSPRFGRRGARKFKYFPKLPTELRDKIWQMAIPPGQIILIDYKIKGNKVETDRPGSYYWKEAAVAKYKVPAMLGTNREARCWAEKVYTCSFGNRLGRTDSAGIGIWIDLDRDVLMFACTKALVSFFNVSLDRRYGLSLYHDVHNADPLPKLHNIGFEEMVTLKREVFTPSFLKVLGKPDNIFGLQKSVRPVYEHELMKTFVDVGWSSVRDALELKYPKPDVHLLRRKDLNAFLSTFGPGLVKKRLDKVVEEVSEGGQPLAESK